MSRYSRMALHFMHAVTNDRDRVYTFLFGTRLTNITRICAIATSMWRSTGSPTRVKDWSGGTRIGHCLAEFNAKWSRRVLGQGAVVLFITDGLDRDGGEGLDQRDGAAAEILPPADLAEPALALRCLSSPDPWARRRSCRMSTISARSTISRASQDLTDALERADAHAGTGRPAARREARAA